MSVDRDELLELALQGARRAGELLLERFERPAVGVRSKSTHTDLVSDADRSSEALLVKLITSKRPRDGIYAEEGGEGASESGLRWVIDPLDGTINYLFGIPIWSVSIAVEDRHGGVVGVVHDPNRGETFTATRGEGAFLNGASIKVRERTDTSSALIGTGFSYNSRVRAVQAQVLTRVLPYVRDVRRPGSAALDLAYVACGRLDGFYEHTMESYDKAAGVLLIQEAGGAVSELPAPLGLSPGVIAAGSVLHEQLSLLVSDKE
ncbi:MAG: inositol monophosphatase [Actinobacteria bacterium]|nr:inositol monophosphatase [Actinomycetota bacterium]